MDYVMREDPGDYLLDDEVDCIEDAEEDILTDDSSDIDRVGEITDEVIDADDYDPMEDLDDEDFGYTAYNDNDYIEYEASDDDITGDVEDVVDAVYDEEEEEEEFSYDD
jgi:hypothetical protein